jgi:hypothetical protein
MRVLLDENIPHGVRGLLREHDVFITSDHSIPYQQNMTGRKLAMLMLSTADWNLLKFSGPRIAAALDTAEPGSFTRVDCGNIRHRRPKLQGPMPT